MLKVENVEVLGWEHAIRDTLLDLANYAIMTVLEMDTPDESHATLYAYDKPIYTVEEDK